MTDILLEMNSRGKKLTEFEIFKSDFVKRIKGISTTLKDQVSIKAISSTKHLVMSDEKKKFNWDYDHCILPIPVSEIDANPNIVQNDGYR